MTPLELTAQITRVLDSKKALDIQVFQVEGITTLADYFIICTGNSTTQVRALSDEVEEKLSKIGVEPHHVEGSRSQWVLLDYSGVVVHIFYKETREFYRLEHLWADGQPIPLSNFLDETVPAESKE